MRAASTCVAAMRSAPAFSAAMRSASAISAAMRSASAFSAAMRSASAFSAAMRLASVASAAMRSAFAVSSSVSHGGIFSLFAFSSNRFWAACGILAVVWILAQLQRLARIHCLQNWMWCVCVRRHFVINDTLVPVILVSNVVCCSFTQLANTQKAANLPDAPTSSFCTNVCSVVGIALPLMAVHTASTRFIRSPT